MTTRLLNSLWPGRSRSAKHSSTDKSLSTPSVSASGPKDVGGAAGRRPGADFESDSNSTQEVYSPKELSARTRARELDPKELERRQQEEKEFIRQNDSQETTIWFLVDVQWLQEWKEFVKRGATLPGPIDNSNLVTSDGRPRPGLKVVEHYRGVNEAVWEFWHERYGGGPVIRRRQLDLYSDDDNQPHAVWQTGPNGLQEGLEDTVVMQKEPEDVEQTMIMPGRSPPSQADDARDNARNRERSPKSNPDRPPVSTERPAPRAAAPAKKSGLGAAVSGALSRGKSVPAARPKREAVAPEKKLCCDKCDGGHETENCPHFKQPREKHKDAWMMMGKAGTLGSQNDGKPAPVVRSARVIRQPGDGSCLFHSLSYGLGGTDGSSLRREICSFISKNPEIDIGPNTLKEWVQYESNSSVSSYASSMSGGSWGGAIEMAALTRMKGVSVHVYEKCSEGYKRISSFDGPRESCKVVNVLYQGRMHYDALVL